MLQALPRKVKGKIVVEVNVEFETKDNADFRNGETPEVFHTKQVIDQARRQMAMGGGFIKSVEASWT